MRLTAVIAALMVLSSGNLRAATPVVTNVWAEQVKITNSTSFAIETTKTVRIQYDLFDADGDPLKVRVEVSSTGGDIYSVPAFTLTGDVGNNISTGIGKVIEWNAGADWDGEYSTNMIVKIFATDNKGYPGLEWGLEVPASGFLMGQDGGAEGSGPSRHVIIPWNYWLSKYEIRNDQYCDFLNMAYAVGYVTRKGTTQAYGQPLKLPGFPGDPVPLLFLGDDLDIRWNVNNFEPRPGRSNFPAKVTWYGAMAFAQFYGYDLPTDAEWEKAARGPDHDDEDQHRSYPWGDAITTNDANFLFSVFDLFKGPSPVGYFTNRANGYLLYDTSGNLAEWCRSAFVSSVEDYPSPESLYHPLNNINITTSRVLRGGSFDNNPLIPESPPALDNQSLRTHQRISADPSDYVYAADYANFDPPILVGAAGFRVVRRDLDYQDRIQPTNTQSITFTLIGTQIATSVLELTATSSSGLPVDFTLLSGPAVLSSNKLSFINTGAVSIMATQPGNTNYLPAEPVVNTFDVIRATAIVTLDNLFQFSNGLPRTVSATTAPTGLTVSITYNGSALAPINSGSYVVTGKVNELLIGGVATGTLVVASSLLSETFDSTNWVVSSAGSWTNRVPSGRWTGDPATYRIRSSALSYSTNGCIGFTNTNSRLFIPGLSALPAGLNLQARAASSNVTGWIEFYQKIGIGVTQVVSRINVSGTHYRRVDANLSGVTSTNLMIYGYRIYVDDVNIFK